MRHPRTPRAVAGHGHRLSTDLLPLKGLLWQVDGMAASHYTSQVMETKRAAGMPRSVALKGGPPKEIELPYAPLVRVIAQARYAPILAIRNPDETARFQELIRGSYPFLQEERAHHIVIAPLGTPSTREEMIWRFSDREKNPLWRVSLSVDFVALETSAYTSCDDFLSRFEHIVEALENSFKPAECQRLGIRYIDRLVGEGAERVGQLICPKILGIALEDGEPPVSLAEAVLHLMTEAAFAAEEGQINARWGSLPGNATYDPSSLEAIAQPSWVLDLDMFTTSALGFEPGPLARISRSFSERIYFVFREIVTDEFLRFYGGKA